MAKHLRVLFSAFPIAARSDEALGVKTYLDALEGYSLEAVERSVRQFITGKVQTHDGRFAPSTAELARNVAQWQDAIRIVEEARNPQPLASGILSVDFGRGPIDMTRLTFAEQEEVLRTGWAPGKSIADGRIHARLQRMGERPKVTVGDPDGDRDVA